MGVAPSFTVRAYPSFRAARLYRVYVLEDALYFIRMKGLIAVSDAGSREFELDAARWLSSLVIGWIGKSSHDNSVARLEQSTPDELLAASAKNFRIAASAVTASSLAPAAFFGGHGDHLARWTIAATDRKATTYQIEDPESLQTALATLPALLGQKITVTVGQ